MVLWDWQVWRCFDDARERLVEKGWSLLGSVENEAAPLAAESGGLLVVFLGLDDAANECVFELRAGDEPPAVILRGLDRVPAPVEAADLLAGRAAALRQTTAPHDRSMYEPVVVAAEAG